jgi:ABC-type sulfate transport system permease component
MKKKTIKKLRYAKNIILVLLAGVAGLMLYSLIQQGFVDILTRIGIENIYLQYTIILAVLFISIIFLGGSIRKSIKEIVR